MKILKHGQYYHPPQLCICPKCGCEFVVDADECEHSYFDDIYGCKCPECDTRSPSVGDYKKRQRLLKVVQIVRRNCFIRMAV